MMAPSRGISEVRLVIDDADIAQCRARLQLLARKLLRELEIVRRCHAGIMADTRR
jgi:hypothetical protein